MGGSFRDALDAEPWLTADAERLEETAEITADLMVLLPNWPASSVGQKDALENGLVILAERVREARQAQSLDEMRALHREGRG